MDDVDMGDARAWRTSAFLSEARRLSQAGYYVVVSDVSDSVAEALTELEKKLKVPISQRRDGQIQENVAVKALLVKASSQNDYYFPGKIGQTLD
ncbi:unnamed protein product [Protopolystoma xenopodis]|uniref:Uncharacterized protein n=1 Tax=Protopolystoma xenopodis TaxID=117903 RepID=A0A3S4ZW35_9PLAT|nr:unnamed protein product [Protopolystoma xenopodis]